MPKLGMMPKLQVSNWTDVRLRLVLEQASGMLRIKPVDMGLGSTGRFVLLEVIAAGPDLSGRLDLRLAYNEDKPPALRADLALLTDRELAQRWMRLVTDLRGIHTYLTASPEPREDGTAHRMEHAAAKIGEVLKESEERPALLVPPLLVDFGGVLEVRFEGVAPGVELHFYGKGATQVS